MKKLTALILSLLIIISGTAAFSAEEKNDKINIEKIEFKNPDFIKGMDISSVISLENSGVKFYNNSGAEEDLLKILANNGVNCIRIRVWNNPFNSENKGYGGGNNDVKTACKIAERAAKYNLSLLIDFHYSDFWADPGKQKAPKAWSKLSVSDKAEMVKEFTKSSLETISAAGAKIAMVQIGNETTNGIAGVYTQKDMAKIYNAGSAAVREFDSDIKTAIHFTNPEKTEYFKSLIDSLSANNVDYDILATSYYPYWHGSLSNLTEVLNYAADTYGKYVMVAETSYANTLKDTDGHENTVSDNNNNTGENLLWDFTAQGQAEEVRAVMEAVNNVKNSKGLGVFYWEGAWISVGDTTDLSGEDYENRVKDNKSLWEEYGSGWASSFSGGYDPDDAGVYYGGSAIDNQAFFDAQGKALPSLKVFDYVTYGNGEILSGDSNFDKVVNILDVTAIQKFLVEKTEINKKAADVNGDNIVSIKDATLIQHYRAKIKVDFPIDININ